MVNVDNVDALSDPALGGRKEKGKRCKKGKGKKWRKEGE
jgi:hypothetical protein